MTNAAAPPTLSSSTPSMPPVSLNAVNAADDSTLANPPVDDSTDFNWELASGLGIRSIHPVSERPATPEVCSEEIPAKSSAPSSPSLKE